MTDNTSIFVDGEDDFFDEYVNVIDWLYGTSRNNGENEND